MPAPKSDIVFTPNELTSMMYEIKNGINECRGQDQDELIRHYEQILNKLQEYYRAIT